MNERKLDYGFGAGRVGKVEEGKLTIYSAGGSVEIELSNDETREVLSLLYDYRAEILNGPDAGMEQAKEESK